MENKKIIYIVAIGFSFVFCIVYYTFFTNFVSPTMAQDHTLYMNQVGLYKKVEGAQSIVDKLKEQNIDAYLLEKEDVTAVVCCLSFEEQQTIEQQSTLKDLGYSYIKKDIEITDETTVSLIENKEYAKALEMIQDASKRDNSEGKTT